MKIKQLFSITIFLFVSAIQAQTVDGRNELPSFLPSNSNNNDNTIQEEHPVPTQEEYAQAILSALGHSGPRLNQMIRALAAYCGTEANFYTGMGGNCDKLYIEALRGNGEIIVRVLRRLRPREVVQQGRTSAEIMAKQQANISSRLAQVRASSGAGSIAGVNISVDGKSLPLRKLTYLSDNDETSSYNGLVSPWGFFINGQISSGDYRYSDSSNEGFDFDTDGLTTGIDYRFNDKTVAGLAIGYASFNSNVATDIIMDSTSLTFSAYGSFNITDNFYVDAKASYGKPDFDQKRSIKFTIDGSNTDSNALGSTQGTQQSMVISSGYQFNRNGWQLTPSVSVEYNKTIIDAFVETGAGAFNVGFSEQDFKTTRFTFALQANKAISLRHGVLIPSVGYRYINENQNNDLIFMRISGMPMGEFFEAPTNFNDSNYSSGHLGLAYVAANGKQAFIQYSKVFGWDGFDRSTLSLGARFEF